MVAAAIVAAAVVGGYATEQASKNASKTLQTGANEGIGAIQTGTQQGVKALTGAETSGAGAIKSAYAPIPSSLSPYTGLGSAAANKLRGLLTGNPANQLKTLESLPGYQFSLQQGDQGTINAASASGMTLSGNTLEALSKYNQGLATTYEGQYAGQLESAAGLGESATATGANLSAQEGGQLAGLYENTGTNLASLYSGEGSSIAGTIGGNAQSQAGITAANASALSGISNNASSDFMLSKLMTQGGGTAAV